VKLAKLNQQRIAPKTGSCFQDASATHTSAETGTTSLNFVRADVLAGTPEIRTSTTPSLVEVLHRIDEINWDIIVSNPPYISPAAFHRDTARSVRKYEPKRALVPPSIVGADDENTGDMFYPHLLAIAEQVHTKMILLEVADLDQAKRVADMARQSNFWHGVEIWRDEPAGQPLQEEIINNKRYNISGRGNGRSVFCWREW